MNKPNRSLAKPHRRRLLKSTLGLGALASASPLLTSCGGSGSDDATGGRSSPASVREARDLHFDLSLARVREPKLFALRSQHHGAALLSHDVASRRQARQANPALADVPDEKLTHYLAGVDLPGKALQGVLVMGTHPATGEPVLAGAHVHAPKAALATVARRRAGAEAGASGVSAKRAHYGIAARADTAGSDINAFSTPFDVATYLVFHHPEVMNLNPELGADILERIQSLPCASGDASCTPYLGELAFVIASLIGANGYPSTTPGSWATLVAQTRLDGSVVRDANGQPVWRFEIADSVAQAVAKVVRQIKLDIYDDPLFQGSNWHATQGIASKTAAAPAAARADQGVSAKAETFAVEASVPVGSTISGIKMVGLEVTSPATRTVKVSVKNSYLRFLSVYAQWFDGAGNPLPPVRTQTPLDSRRANYIDLVGTNDQIMGIPFQGDTVSTSEVEFDFPDGAARADLMFGSLGLGGEAFAPEALAGSILTLGFNIGLPTMLLAFGVYTDLKEGWEGIFSDEPLLETVIKEVRTAIYGESTDLGPGLYFTVTSHDIQPFITGVANAVIQAILGSAPSILEWLTAVITSETFEQAVPFVGVALKVLSIAADATAIAVSVGDVLSARGIERNTIALTMDTTVRISRDPRDFQFPASATRWTVDAIYDGGAVPRTVSGTVSPGRVDPIDAVLSGVPSGGKVAVRVAFYSADGCLVGTAQTDPIVNLPASASQIPVQIVELVVPLRASTVHSHRLKLAWAGGNYAWAGGAAPRATRANLCQGRDGAICDLGGITVHTASGMAGYAFRAGGQGVGLCGAGTGSTGIVDTIQNVFLGQNPASALKFPSCGFDQPAAIVYDQAGPAVGGRHFFLQPAAGGGSLVRSVTLDASTPFDLAQATTWGRFAGALDSVAVVTSSYLVGVNRQTHKMEVLKLPAQAVDPQSAPRSVAYSAIKAGQGARAGLLDTPVAVAAYKGAVLVLEQGNARIQALDTSGNPVLLFSGGTSPFAPLRAEAGAVYLDLGVESAGHMYVLSYVNDGLAPTDYRLDVYTPDGAFLARTASVAAARLAVDYFRNVYTLNYEAVADAPRVQPSVSQWLPVTPDACPTTLPSARAPAAATLACGPARVG